MGDEKIGDNEDNLLQKLRLEQRDAMDEACL